MNRDPEGGPAPGPPRIPISRCSRSTPGTIVRMPANVPHAVDAVERTRLLLVMLPD
jgi:hypothetical protein